MTSPNADNPDKKPIPGLVPYDLGQAARLAQAAKVYALIADGDTQEEACEKVGVSPRTLQSWAKRPEVRKFVADLLEEAGQAAAISIAQNLGPMLSRQIAISVDPDTHARDATNAVKAVLAVLARFQPLEAPPAPAPRLPAPEDVEDEAETGTAAFSPTFVNARVEVHPAPVQLVLDQPAAGSRPAPETDTPDPAPPSSSEDLQ